MNDIDRLRELVDVLVAVPGDGRDLVRAYIDPELLNEYAESCSHVILHAYLGGGARRVGHDEMVDILSSAYLSAFALGCAWATMKAGSGEK